LKVWHIIEIKAAYDLNHRKAGEIAYEYLEAQKINEYFFNIPGL
jgi:hypothetical protein